jgi:CheY-like chemotaxis protein
MYTVLVIEDESDIRLTYRILLETAGYLVVEASTGEFALSIVRTFAPDLIILDLQLSDVDGWQVLEELRREQILPWTPIVIASANAGPDVLSDAIPFGCTEVFTKPFSSEELLATLTRLMNRRDPLTVLSD